MSTATAIPDIDARIGIGAYATKFPGLGGGYGIRSSPADFAVYEILSQKVLGSLSGSGRHDGGTAVVVGRRGVADNRRRERGGYAVYVLQKRGIDTTHALSAVHRMTGVRLKPLGLKDASATTEQFVCSAGAGKRPLRDIDSSRFGLRFAGYASKPLTKKQMLGNKFRIRIAGEWDDDNSRRIGGKKVTPADFEEYDVVPNFYGYQRFGSNRPVTHLVGGAVIRRDPGEAVRLILEFESPYDTAERRELRSQLADPASYARSVKRLPPGMDTERVVLEGLAEHGDPARALRAIPIQLRRLYISAYQSYIFNRALSAAVAGGENLLEPESGDVCFDRDGKLFKYDGRTRGGTRGGGTRPARTAHGGGGDGGRTDADLARARAESVAVPVVGYGYYAKTRFAPYVLRVLEDEQVAPADFFVKDMPSTGGEGGFRDAVIQCSGYSWDHDSKTVSFSLMRGSFATVLLREVMKPPDPVAAGF